MSDLVEGLRYYAGGDWPCPLERLDEAADELEQQSRLISDLVNALMAVTACATFDSQSQCFIVENDAMVLAGATIAKATGDNAKKSPLNSR
jgi:hypothetical protein